MEIRADQILALQQDAWRRFEEEMVEHSRGFAPKHCKVVGDAQLRLAVRSSILRAGQYGFTKRGPIRLYIELGLLCGSSFDTDPQFVALSTPLRQPEDQMLRAQQMHEEHTRFAEHVPELSSPQALAALRQLAAGEDGTAVAAPFPGLETEFAQRLRHDFPERVGYMGEGGLAALLQQGRRVAAHHGFSIGREVRLTILLMFVFGHGCAVDPMYPWIMRTLQDETIETVAARTDHLEKRMFVWLEHIVGGAAVKPGA